MTRRRLPAVFVGVVLACSGCSPIEHLERQPWFALRRERVVSFEDVAVGALPERFVATETNPTGTASRWQVERDEARDSNVLKHVEAKAAPKAFALLLSTTEHGPDVELSVRMKSISGKTDKGGGLVWRAKDAGNYYLARWSLIDKNLRLFRVVDGARTLLANVNVDTDPNAWHTLSARSIGTSHEVLLDGEKLIVHSDTTYPGSGRIGLWTRSDAITSFDDLRLRER